MWQYILTTFSAVIFFGFVALGIRKFGLQDCYSAYGPKWGEISPLHGFNLWSFVTILTAVLLIPVIIEAGNIAPTWQFAGFLAPTFIVFVGMTPDYQQNKMSWWIHQIGAWGAVLFVLLFVLFVFPTLFWFVIVYCIIAGVLTSYFGKWSWMLWFEMATYASIFTIMFLAI